jgi:phosphate transport system substrate-binding protein
MRIRLLRGLPILCLSASILFFISCSSSPSARANAASAPQVIGAGSTFIYPEMSRWIDDYQHSHPEVEINYQSIGSGGGIRQLKEGVVNFGASDMPLDNAQLKEMPALVQIPESAGPVCVTYNLEHLSKPLNLSARTLSGIYLGTIKNWHDAAIGRENPGVNLPKEDIVVVHRSDGSGTTNIFTTYLAAVSPKWDKEVGRGLSVKWPVGIGGKGSEGVTGLVKQNPGSIGYVELAYADENKLPVAAIENKAGKFVLPTAEGTSAAIDAFSIELAKDIRTPIVDPPASAKTAYPISGLTFLLIPKTQTKSKTSGDVKNFVGYVITGGQVTAGQLHYAEIPASLQNIDKSLLNKVSSGS